MAKIITIVNRKGGCGKTTTTKNLGYSLAKKGYKVLLVDYDPQCNTTKGLSKRNYRKTVIDMIEQLIEEHFEPKENTEEYKHFKLHSDSSLKNLTKVELIDYIKMLYHNWGVADEQLKNCIDKAKELSDSNDELERTIYSLDCELSDVYNPKPYKFEDLKVGMWVYDSIYKSVYLIKEISKNKKIRVCTFGWIGKFEENRFFPVQCANLTKMEVKK